MFQPASAASATTWTFALTLPTMSSTFCSIKVMHTLCYSQTGQKTLSQLISSVHTISLFHISLSIPSGHTSDDLVFCHICRLVPYLVLSSPIASFVSCRVFRLLSCLLSPITSFVSRRVFRLPSHLSSPVASFVSCRVFHLLSRLSSPVTSFVSRRVFCLPSHLLSPIVSFVSHRVLHFLFLSRPSMHAHSPLYPLLELSF